MFTIEPVPVEPEATNSPYLTVPETVFEDEVNSSSFANVKTSLAVPPAFSYLIKSVFGSDPAAAANPITFAETWFVVLPRPAPTTARSPFCYFFGR